MKLPALFLSILVACDISKPPAASPTPPCADTPVEGANLAVVRLIRVDEEASNMGGRHFTFEVDAPGAPRFVHGGGHAYRGEPLDSADTPMGYYIAEIVSRAPFHVWDGGWGIGGLPIFTGTVRRAVPVGDHAEASDLLRCAFDPANGCDIVDFAADPCGMGDCEQEVAVSGANREPLVHAVRPWPTPRLQ